MFKYQIKHKFAVAGLVVLERNNNMNGDCPETFYQQRAQEVRIYLKHQAGQLDTTQG